MPTLQQIADIFRAARAGDLAVVERLIETDLELLNTEADLEERSRIKPIFAAAIGGHQPIIEYLESKGANLFEKLSDGTTLLMAAVSFGHTLLVKWLILIKTLNPTEKSDHGNTVLELAAKYNHADIIYFLVRHCKMPVTKKLFTFVTARNSFSRNLLRTLFLLDTPCGLTTLFMLHDAKECTNSDRQFIRSINRCRNLVRDAEKKSAPDAKTETTDCAVTLIPAIWSSIKNALKYDSQFTFDYIQEKIHQNPDSNFIKQLRALFLLNGTFEQTQTLLSHLSSQQINQKYDGNCSLLLLLLDQPQSSDWLTKIHLLCIQGIDPIVFDSKGRDALHILANGNYAEKIQAKITKAKELLENYRKLHQVRLILENVRSGWKKEKTAEPLLQEVVADDWQLAKDYLEATYPTFGQQAWHRQFMQLFSTQRLGLMLSIPGALVPVSIAKRWTKQPLNLRDSQTQPISRARRLSI